MAPQVNGSTAKRFELPALDLNFGNITDGTNIPPPPASPLIVTPPPTPPLTKNDGRTAEGNVKAAGQDGTVSGIKRRAEDEPLTPAGSPRQGSLRRLFSKNKLNASYTEGQLTSPGNTNVNNERPASRGAGSVMTARRSRRGSWLRLFRGGDDKRFSTVFDDAPAQKGPKPPMIPELKELEADDGSLGNDLFKNIN